MADTTNDIWNDDDGEDRPRKRPHRFRRFLVFFLTLVIVLGVVILAAWRDGTGFDTLRRYFTYGNAQAAGEGFHYDASSSNRFAAVGDGLAVLSGTELRVMDKEGGEVWSTAVKMLAPAMAQGGGCAVAYDVGGTELYVVGSGGKKLELTADDDEPFISATLNDDGWLAVTTKKKNYKGWVSVYNSKMDLVFVFKSSQRFVTDAYVANDCKSLAAVTLGQENSVFVSNIVLYDLNKQDPVADYDISDGLVLAIGQQDKNLITVSDTALTFAGAKGEVEATYNYGGAYLREYDFTGDGFTVLLLNRYQSGSVGRLVTVGPDGEEIASLDVNEEILSVSAEGRYIAVLYTDNLVVYNQDLQVYASLEGTDYAKEVLVRKDGSALLVASERAHLFLP